MLKIKVLWLLIPVSALFISCAVQKPINAAILPEYATSLFKAEAGTVAPERKLYHTYKEDYSGVMYNDNYDYYSIWSFSKIEGNHVEGVWSRSGGGVNRSYPIFGRCDFNKLYIYTQGTPAFNVLFEYPASYSLSAQEIFVFQIGQNGRVLTREKFAYSLVDGSLKWRKEPEYNVDLDSRKNYVVRYSSTGFISKTDDYIGEERKSNTPASQTLTEKLKELKDLLNQNIISQEEYDTARKKLLEK